MVGEG